MPWDDRIRRRIKLRDIDVLIAVVEAGSMGKAAARFNMTQPAVSKLVADLEGTLGARLLVRSRQGVEPTQHGRALVKRGLAMFDELRQGVRDLDFLSDPTAGELRIACTEPVAAAIVSPVIDRLSRQHPRMSFHVVAGDTPVLLRDALAERKVDFLISRVHNPLDDTLSAETLFHDQLVVATGAVNPLTRRRRIELAELAGEPWILPFDGVFSSLVTQSFHAAGLKPPRLTVSTVSINLRTELLATGRFVTVVPGFSLKLPRRHAILRALPVMLPNSRHPIAIVTVKNRELSPLARLFCDHVRVLTKPLAKS